MAFDHQSWNRRFIADPDYNDASSFGVVIERHTPARGERFWKIIGVHHLTPEENSGNHHLYLEVLNSDGDRIKPVAWISWGWEGQRSDESASPARGDKPDSEPIANIGIGWGQIIEASCAGRNSVFGTDGLSDKVKGIHTNHPDEDQGNTQGHHSFYVCFQEKIASGSDVIPPPDPEPEPTPDPPPDTPEPDSDPPPPNSGNVIGKVTIRDSLGPATFIVPWLANVYESRPEGTFLEALINKERLQEMINEAQGDLIKIHIELQRDDRVP